MSPERSKSEAPPIRQFIDWLRATGTGGVEAIVGFHIATDFFKTHLDAFKEQFKDQLEQIKKEEDGQ